MITVLIIAIVYTLSTYFMYEYVRIAYSKGGRWEMSHPPAVIMLPLVFFPILNTLVAIVWWSLGNPHDVSKYKGNYPPPKDLYTIDKF